MLPSVASDRWIEHPGWLLRSLCWSYLTRLFTVSALQTDSETVKSAPKGAGWIHVKSSRSRFSLLSSTGAAFMSCPRDSGLSNEQQLP
jgi:hypothetical protein